MTPKDDKAIWDLITSKLDYKDRRAVGLPLIQTDAPRVWLEVMLTALAGYLDDDPALHSCENDCSLHHCDDCHCDGCPGEKPSTEERDF